METIANVVRGTPYHATYKFQKQFLIIIIFLVVIGTLSNPSSLSAEPASVSNDSPAEKYMMQALNAFQRGVFEQAVLDWREAVKLYEKEGKSNKQRETLALLAQAYQYIGQYNEALKCLKSALVLAEKSGDRAQIASVLGSLGNLHITLGPPDKAFQYLNEGLSMAKGLGDSGLSATILNNLGNLFITQQKYNEALGAYLESMTLAQKSNNDLLAVRALTNAAMAHMENGQYKKSKELLDRALDETWKLDPSHDKAYGLINIGLTYRNLRAHLLDQDKLFVLSSQALNEALIVSETIGDLRSLSYTCGYLGTLSEDQKHYQEALKFTRRATLVAQQVNAPESLYLWQWQTGRLLKVIGETEEAISAYRNCIHTLQSIRQEMSTCYGTPQISYRESVEPIYFGFVDLLLQHSASMNKREQVEPLLMEAREAVELLKVAELRDYFQDECMGAPQFRITRLDTISKRAVVIYPLVLSDRTELLVSLPSGLKRFSIKIGAEVLTREVRKFREKLEKRTTWEYLPHAQKLYDWLIRPLEPDLTSMTTDTLVFVPDGPLRTIPMAALHDGKQFLINKYAIAITPGLNLTDPRPVKRENVKLLSAGLTDSVQGFPPLPNVADELQAIQGLYGGYSMMNRDFLIRNLEKELRDKQLTIIHIASHGHFESDIRKSFLLTFDGKLTMDQLEQYVGLFKFREDPLELLTLSACETAVGDNRAALGLAGIAIKSGARSALATLWQIDDRATSELVAEFYRQLKDPAISRAIALKRAQLKLLNDRSYDHPSYWSPFILINNWL
ncbi:MAG: CHAT domain-containing protein [Thermodesulfobacteriota bacterium]|jgi:CHAT domain-containing protein/Tfp pilus assembly protein PilF